MLFLKFYDVSSGRLPARRLLLLWTFLFRRSPVDVRQVVHVIASFAGLQAGGRVKVTPFTAATITVRRARKSDCLSPAGPFTIFCELQF